MGEDKIVAELRKLGDVLRASSDDVAEKAADRAIKILMPTFREECGEIAKRIAKDSRDEFFLSVTGEEWSDHKKVRDFFKTALPASQTASRAKNAFINAVSAAIGAGIVIAFTKGL